MMDSFELLEGGQTVAFGNIVIDDLKYVVDRSINYSQIRVGEASYHSAEVVRDYEGSFDQYRSVTARGSSDNPEWWVRLEYTGRLNSHLPDFEELAVLDRNTAYKHRPSGPQQMVGFNLNAIRCGKQTWNATESKWMMSEETRDLVSSNITRLKTFYQNLDEGLKTLGGWASLGLAMKLRCVSGECGYHESVFANDKVLSLATVGHTLERLREKLVCKKCGQRTFRLFPCDNLAKG